ncbi:MAG: hypothetical protein E7401_03450 [Ruminococcaceae bacterium]|nr:hypothetical protein [Oscillospiraceae bacterium]
MAFTYSFVDNQIYGTDDINDITRSMTGAGVAPFISKDSYSTSDLNVMTSALVEAGASLEGCKCSVKNAGTAEMSVTVAQGIVFFESGVRLTVDADGYVLPVIPNTAGFVYAYFSPSLQKADILFNTELPSDGEYVLLAEITADGDLRDKREFARSKVATMGSNAEHSIDESRITVYETYDEAPAYSNTEKIIAEIDLSGIDITKFNHLIYRYHYTGTGSTAPTYQEKYFNFIKSARESFYIKGSLYYHSAMFDIIFEENKFVIVVNAEAVFGSYKSAFKSAIPYFKLV